MEVRQILSEKVSRAFARRGYPEANGAVSASNRPDLCQYQCNGAMALAKAHRASPLKIAEEVAGELAGDAMFSSVAAAAPGFINITLADSQVAAFLNEMKSDGRLGMPTLPPKTVVVDYGGPNIAKPLHVGHLRSAIIGDAMCRLARYLGHRVIGDIHLGDWGLQMGLVIAALEDGRPDLPYFGLGNGGAYPDGPPLTADELNEVYPSAAARAKADPAFAARAAAATVALQAGREGYVELWRRIREASLGGMEADYGLLGVSFDEWLGESDAEPYVARAMGILREKGLLRESEGALVIDVGQPGDREPMPPIIVKKSDGGDMYGTTDIGTLLQRAEDWSPDEIWYVVDARQSLHFKQVFRAAQLAGIVDPARTKLMHFPFGTMKGKDGKPFKTREGGVMRLSDMIELVTASALEKAASSSVPMGEAEQRDVARKVGVAALKVGDLVNHWAKDYVFDIDRFLMAEGKTGPYLQYAAVRIGSVLEKARQAGIPEADGTSAILPPDGGAERDLMLRLLGAPDALLRAYDEKAPSVLCELLFDVAGAANRFYYEKRIISCQDAARRASWLALLSLARGLMEALLGLLGVEVPPSM